MTFNKIIHQMWNDTNVPVIWKTSPELWKQNHPQWEYILWTVDTHKKLLQDKYPWFVPYYDNYEYFIQKVDAVRYFILYTYGGVYCDLDVEPLFPIDILLETYFDKGYNLILSKTSNLGGLTNGIMIAKDKYHPLWSMIFDELMKRAKNNKFIGKHLRVMYSTGPMLITHVCKQYLKKNLDIKLLPYHHLQPASVKDKKPYYMKGGYMRVLKGSTWVAFDGKFFIFMYSNATKIILIIFVIIISLVVIKKLQKRKDGGR